MKKLLLLCCFLVGISAVGHAQGGGRRGGTPEQMVDRMKTNLAGITDDQSAKLLVIYQARAKSMDSLRTAMNGDMSGMREKMAPITAATNAKVNAVLTPEQAAAYKKQQDEMRARMQQGGN